MAVVHCLASINAFDPVTQTRVQVRVASAQLRSITGLNGQRWIPAMVEAPTLSMQFFNGDFTAPISPGGASIQLALRSLVGPNAWPNALRYFWPDAEVVIYAAPAGSAWPWPVAFRGRVSDFRAEAATLTLSASVDSEPFERDVLTDTYAGTGGAEGAADLKNRLRPLILGAVQNAEPVPVNLVDSIYQFSGYGPIEAVDVLYERGSAYGAAAADYANYAALQAATVAKGTWATCNAEGLIKLGAPAYGVITGDVRGHKVGATSPTLTGAVIQALATLAGVDPAKLVTSTLTALDAAAAYPIGVVISDQVRFGDLARELALYCNRQAGIGLDGRFFVTRPNPSATPSSDTLRYARSKESRTSPPYAKTTFGAARCWRVHTSDEIAYAATLTDRGNFSAAETYREGDIVTSVDGSRWVYVNQAASSGNAPPLWPTVGNAYWDSLAAPQGNGQNALYNGGFRLGTAGWTMGSMTLGTGMRGNYVEQPVGVGGTFVAAADLGPLIGSGQYVTLSAAFSGAASTLAYLFVDIEWRNLGNNVLVSYSSATANGVLFYNESGTLIRRSQVIQAPAATDGSGGVRPIVRIVGVSDVAYVANTRWVEQIKLEYGSIPTAFSDEATDGALYGDGTLIDALKPLEVASDVTSYVICDAGAEVVIACDYTGTPKAGQINPRYVQLRLIRAGVDRTADATWSIIGSSGDVGATISDTGGTKGRLNISAADTDGTLLVQATLGGIARTFNLKARRQLDPPPSGGSGGGTSDSGSISGSATSTTMVAIGDELELTIGSTGNAALSASYQFSTDSAGAESAYARWYKWNGSAFVAIGSEQISTSTFGPGAPLPGDGGCFETDSGNTAASVQKYKLYGRSSASHNTGFSGTCSAVGS